MATILTDIRDAALVGDIDEVRSLLQGQPNLNSPLSNGDRLLVGVAGMGDARLEIVKLLVDHGADVNSPIGGMSLLKWIQDPSYCDNQRTIAFLKSRGARATNL